MNNTGEQQLSRLGWVRLMNGRISPGRWEWIKHEGQILRNVGVLQDGSLYNPNGYDEAVVREVIRYAEEQVRIYRSSFAKKAAVTRHRRQERRTYEVAEQIVAHRAYGPREHCVICGKALTDSESIARGIGSDCWQKVLEAISRQAEQEGRLGGPGA